MHLVFLNQYYPPDAAPTGVMLEAVVERLVRDGHEVTVLCASGGYAGRELLKAEMGGAERGTHSAIPLSDQPSTLNHQLSTFSPRIIRIGASSFGRGTFIGKLLDYASYYVGVALKLWVMNPQPDRIVALTTPPLLSVLARLFSKIRRADHAHWVMDLYPDVMVAHGMLGENNVIYRILAGLARWGFGGRRCAAILTLGPDMAERCGRVVSGPLSVIGKKEELDQAILALSNHQPSTLNHQHSSVQWVPLWGSEAASVQCPGFREEENGDECIAASYDPQSSPLDSPLSTSSNCPSPINNPPSTSPLRHQRGWADDELIVMYSGNMGLGHRFGEILAAALRSVGVSPTSHTVSQTSARPSNHQPATIDHQLSRTRFVFFGGGKRRVQVEAFVRENPRCAVEVHDYAPADELVAHLQSADVHFVSLDLAWSGTMVPSKLQGIFAVGRPVIFIGSADSSIGRWVTESGGGWVVPAGDVDGLLTALDEARQPEIRLTRGRAAEVYARSHFDKQTNVARVAAILAGEGTPRPFLHPERPRSR